MILLAIVPFVLLLLIFQIIFSKQKTVFVSNNQPFVSVLLAVRNEENVLNNCLIALSKLNYPSVEILIGNDNSTDETAQIINLFTSQFPHFIAVPIQEEKFGKGKANVLAQLAQKAKGEYYFFTDADIVVNQDWIENLLAHFETDTGIVTGCTHTNGNSLFEKWQSLDWSFSQGIMYFFSRFYNPITAMGNNMAVSKKAYDSVGGYENIPFSLTEDFALFKEITNTDFTSKQCLTANEKVHTLPLSTFNSFLHQRKRWMKGAFSKLPIYVSILVLFQNFYLAIVIYESLNHNYLALLFLLLKISLQSIYLKLIHYKVKEKLPIWACFTFELYVFFTGICLVINYLLPSKVNWKGRIY